MKCIWDFSEVHNRERKRNHLPEGYNFIIYLMNEIKNIGKFHGDIPITIFMVLSKVFKELHFLKKYLFIYYLFDCIGSLMQHARSSLHHVGSFIVMHGFSS